MGSNPSVRTDTQFFRREHTRKIPLWKGSYRFESDRRPSGLCSSMVERQTRFPHSSCYRPLLVSADSEQSFPKRFTCVRLAARRPCPCVHLVIQRHCRWRDARFDSGRGRYILRRSEGRNTASKTVEESSSLSRRAEGRSSNWEDTGVASQERSVRLRLYPLWGRRPTGRCCAGCTEIGVRSPSTPPRACPRGRNRVLQIRFWGATPHRSTTLA